MKILVYPKYTNPYQELLYTELRKKGDTVEYLAPLTKSLTLDLLLFPFRVSLWRLRGYQIFHLHWANAFSLYTSIWRVKFFKLFVYLYYILCLKTIKIVGYKFVWTAHNALPHEPIFLDDISARRKLVGVSDLVIAHSQNTIDKLKEINAEPKRSIIIPHGNYIDAYPHTITSHVAREKLGVKQNQFVYLYLGLIRPYKGVETLLDAYSILKNENNRLIVAGKCNDSDLEKRLFKLSSSPDSHVMWSGEYIADADLQIYFAAADVVVLPFNKITTSGSALLALSFGKAVIVPSLGDLTDLPNNVSYKYTSGKTELAQTMRLAEKDHANLKIKSREAKLYAEKLHWPSIAKKTHDAMKELVA